MTSEEEANELITASSNVTPIRPNGYWYNYDNQRFHIFNLARELRINDGSLTDAECIQQAKEFVEEFRVSIINKPL